MKLTVTALLALTVFGCSLSVEEPPIAEQSQDQRDFDKDGVINEFDKEPNTPKNVITDGAGRAMDIDQDGVFDGIDKCPTIKGAKENNGCPIVKTPVYNNTPTSEGLLNNLNFQLRGIKFDTGKSIIKPQYFSILSNAVSIIKANTDKKFMIVGYTDCLGKFSSNQKLSERRANSIKNYLINKGVSTSQLFATGQGESSPINTCNPCNSCSKSEHLENRRIEFKVL